MTLGRASCASFEEACRREWLVANGLGGYACGTVGGANTRRYHGFLVASLSPPVERTLLVAKIDVGIEYLGRRYELAANEFAGGAVDPRGFIHLESFCLEDGVPTWRYALADALIEQRIFMAPEAQTSYLTLTLTRASAPLQCALKPLVTCRDHHAHARGARAVEAQGQGPHLRVRMGADAPVLQISVAGARYQPLDAWNWNFLHREEYGRGLDALEDLYAPGRFEAALEPGRTLELAATIEEGAPPAAAEVRAALGARAQARRAALPRAAPAWVQSLAVATDTFLARRGTGSDAGATVIAGFPWFADWGRDTMIALPGLTTALARHATARHVLSTYAALVDHGMLPNRFPDEGAPPEYNTADATLWLFRALDAHLKAQRDAELVRQLKPVLMNIIRAHLEGTRFGIRVDPEDGLLRAGVPGLQLTWMDAKQGAEVFTPRIGKPVEINALWLNALEVAARVTKSARSSAEERLCAEWLERGRAGFQRFWNARAGCLYDVIDTESGGVDERVRPNQILAVSLPFTALSPEQMRSVVEVCARELLTSYGLRSLSPSDAGYRGQYCGNAWERDAAYHQGTVWSWLLGAFALAHYRVYGDAARAQSFLEPIAQHLEDACIGQVSEIFEGDAPHEPRGCFAQAWSVAEILRAWLELEAAKPGRQADKTPRVGKASPGAPAPAGEPASKGEPKPPKGEPKPPKGEPKPPKGEPRPKGR